MLLHGDYRMLDATIRTSRIAATGARPFIGQIGAQYERMLFLLLLYRIVGEYLAKVNR